MIDVANTIDVDTIDAIGNVVVDITIINGDAVDITFYYYIRNFIHTSVFTLLAVDFYNQINLIFGSISTFCTAEICPIMSAGSRFEYLWADPGSKVRPQPVPAIQYIDNVLNWVKNLLEDEEIFPSSYEDSFPSNFAKIIKNVYKKLFRIYAHIYYSHFEQIMQSGEEAHLNTCFKHFYFFIREFRLVDDREMAPLAELIQNIGDR
eukprot:TRINITY_DN2431_c1_g1_i2.p1 TRINITY_DN2431_c1_g1~~TRINITY_DN2431_c1_g1_i2.p1  ORF type:complete len:206 (-),score=33.19 TRINITY_DN2431_c1_g1_i2:43-660(-)